MYKIYFIFTLRAYKNVNNKLSWVFIMNYNYDI